MRVASVRPINFLKELVALDVRGGEGAGYLSGVEFGLCFIASVRIGLGLAAGPLPLNSVNRVNHDLHC